MAFGISTSSSSDITGGRVLLPPLSTTQEVAEVALPSKDGVAALPKRSSIKFSTYIVLGGIGLFLLGSLGFWIVRDKPDKQKLQKFGRTLAISGLLLRGVGEIVALKEKGKIA